MRFFVALALLFPPTLFAQIDRAGNVISDGDETPVGAAGVAFIALSFAVMHFLGERAMFKMWGGFFVVAIIIGVAKKFL